MSFPKSGFNGLVKNAPAYRQAGICGVALIRSVLSCLWSVAFQNTTDEGQPATNKRG
jgi:hypothetical protein